MFVALTLATIRLLRIKPYGVALRTENSTKQKLLLIVSESDPSQLYAEVKVTPSPC